MIVKDLKYKIVGGGCGSSKQIYNPQQINFKEKNVDLDDEFKQKFEAFTNKKNINKEIESESQGAAQVDIIKCLRQHEILIRTDIIIYKPKVIELIDVYLIYALTGSSSSEALKQDEIRKIGSKLKKMKESFEIESCENPTCDLIFYFDILGRFNSTSIIKDVQNQSQLTQAEEFIKAIVKLGSGALKSFGGNLKEGFDSDLKDVRSLLNKYKQSKTNQIFTYLLDIWVRKKDQFQDRIFNLTLLEELQFNITTFNESCIKNDYETDLVILTLIKIDHQFSIAVIDDDNQKILSQELSLNHELIKVFLQMLIQKSDSKSFIDEMKSFLKFTVENHTYRFLTISILLKYNKIIQNTNDSQNYKEQIMEYLCYKYLSEKDKSVKLAFETSREFVDHFNSKIEKDEFKDKIIQLSNERSKVLKIFDLEKFEEKIENIQDIERMISNTIIEKWERDVKRRQKDNIAQKDDVLLESITYQEGNKILKQDQQQIQTNEKSQPHQKSNALQEILNNFLQGSIQTNENQNMNISNTEGQNKCKVLGILAEGGTGKSMLIKKLETHLIQLANSNSENENYIPLLIKCNSLDPSRPSIENYLLAQGVNMKQINSIKKSDRNKVILLDGYDEFTGQYFRVYSQLNLNQWKNTKVIVTSRKEKLDLSDACVKFSLDGENGLRDETSFSIVKLEEFTHENILEYCEMYFKQYRTKEEKYDDQQCKMDMDVMIDCMKNTQLESLLYLPINLYLFTRMIVQVKDQAEISKIKENITDQIGIQQIFFNEQFRREAQDFVQTQIKEIKKRDKDFELLIVNSFFEYFQSISMKMFLNKGKVEITNFLQIQKDQIKFKLSNQIENKLSEKEKNILHEKIIHYVNSKIITRSKEEITMDKTNSLQNKNYLIEFKHKSLFEYFVARAMKYDFDFHGDNIYKLTVEQLKEFNINKKSIMNAGHNQSEQQILIKLYKMIKNEIESNEFYSNYHQDQIHKNSRYIQYIKKSTIEKNSEISQLDLGASNMLSALFLSKYTYSKLQLNFCSLSKLYVYRQKSNLINFQNCNLENSYLKSLHIDYDSCNIQFATFDSYHKIFDTSNIYSFNQVIWDKKNILYTITQSGFINSFKVVNQNIVLQKSKQLSLTSLRQILTMNNDTLLVSTQYSILLINSISFDLQQSYKFKNDISNITKIKENILVTFKNGNIFHGSFQNGFRKTNMIGSGCEYNESKQILLVFSSNGDLFLYNSEENFKLIKTIKGHTQNVNSAAFSPDGKYLATGSIDKTCKIWNAEKDFELINTIQGHTSILSVTFSADGKYLAAGSLDKTHKIWNVEKGFELINAIQGHRNQVISVAFSADGKYLATGSQDNTCKIWNTEKNFDLINTIQGHSDQVNSVAFSADGKYLATGSKDNTCRIWIAEKGFEIIYTIQGHTNPIQSVAFSGDGKYLATGSWDNTCKIWNAEKDFELLNTISGHASSIWSVAFSADGKQLATASVDKTFKIWNVEKDFELTHTIQAHTSSIQSVAFSADGKYLATGSRDKTCKVWNAEKDFELINTIKGHNEYVNSVAFSNDGKYLATGSEDKTCKIWNTEKEFELINTIKAHSDKVNSVTFSTDGKYLATCSSDCQIWNAEKGFKQINTIQGHSNNINSVAFSVDGKYLSTGSQDKTCLIYNAEKSFELINNFQGICGYSNSVTFSVDGKYLATGREIWNVQKGFELVNRIQGHTSLIETVAFSTDGKYLATGSMDKTCKIWNAQKGFELIKTISDHREQVNSVAFSVDGKYLATGSEDDTCKIWNAEKGFELIKTIERHFSNITQITFSAEGKYLAIGSWKKKCKIFNTEKDFELIYSIQGHTEQIESVTFSADGKYLATGSRDKTCKIWNAEQDFELINTIQGHSDRVCTVSFTADGKYLVTGSKDNTCKIWNAEKGFELINTIQGHSSYVLSIAFSGDGKYLSIGSSTCKIWNAEKGFELINTIKGQANPKQAIAFSADGLYLATGSRDKTCKIWNVEKGFELINTIQGHTSSIQSVAFSSDGKYLATGSEDKTCKIWNTEKGYELINTIQGHTSGLTSIAFSADGKYLATSSEDKTCKLWNAEKDFELINTIQGHTDSTFSVAFSIDGNYICMLQNDKNCSIFDLQNFKIINEQNNFEELKEKYKFEYNENTFEKMNIFENIFIL